MARSGRLNVLPALRGARGAGGEELQPGLSRTEVAVGVIRDRIIDLTLEPGSKIDDRLLMERFNLGRTPAREALNRLVSEGFVKIKRNKGAFVSPLGIDDVKHFFDAYFSAERMSGFFCNLDHDHLVDDLKVIQADHDQFAGTGDYLSLTKANSTFHTRIAQETANDYIYEFCSRLNQQARRLSHVIYKLEEGKAAHQDRNRRKIHVQHFDIIEAIAAGDRERLIDLLTEHAQLFNDRIVRAISEARASEISFVEPARG